MTRTHRGAAAPRSQFLGVLLLAGLAGLAYLVIGLVNDDPASGVAGLAVMLGYAAVLALTRRRSETAALLAGEATDERRRFLTLRATALTGNVLVLAIVVGGLVTLATGSDAFPVFGGLAVLAGATFVGGLLYYQRSS